MFDRDTAKQFREKMLESIKSFPNTYSRDTKPTPINQTALNVYQDMLKYIAKIGKIVLS